MGPIQPLHFDRWPWTDRSGPIGNSNPAETGAASGGANATFASALMPNFEISSIGVSSLTVSNSVSQMLKSIGGGLQDNKMLELMIALLILMALLEQQTSGRGESSGSSLLGRLGGSASALQVSHASYSSTIVTFQQTSISYFELTSQTLDAIRNGGESAGGRRLDLTA